MRLNIITKCAASYVVAIAVAAAAVCLLCLPTKALAQSTLVFAPSSMTDVLNDIVDEYERTAPHKVTLSFAGTPQLARQLDAGAPADLFISADQDWMHWVIERGLVKAEKVFPLVGNRLVVAVRRKLKNGAALADRPFSGIATQ